ncbi:hypothetical protein GOODEAATRI_025984, partial [Goodea atripinnis]
LRLFQGAVVPAELCHGIQGTLNLDDNPVLPDEMPTKVLKPEDYERGNRGPWRPQLGFNPNRQQAHLDQSGFRALG